MNFKYYMLKNGEIVPTTDSLEFSKWFENIDERRVDYTEINDNAYVSTVCLGIDHNHWGEGPPVIFESMAFGVGIENEIQDRYSTLEEAKAGHEKMVKEIMDQLGVKQCYPRGKRYRRIDSEWQISKEKNE